MTKFTFCRTNYKTRMANYICYGLLVEKTIVIVIKTHMGINMAILYLTITSIMKVMFNLNSYNYKFQEINVLFLMVTNCMVKFMFSLVTITCMTKMTLYQISS